MSIEFIGSLVNASARNSFARSGGTDADYPARMARLHEESGFDRLLVGHSSSSPDGFTVADTVLNATSRLGVLLAHRPGFVAPTVAARQYATLDAFHPGRVALHVISGGDDADQLRDGDTSDKAARYRRSGEFLDIVKLEWSSADAVRLRGRVLPGAGGAVLGPPGGRRAAGLLRGRLGRGGPGRRQARRRLRVLGRAAGRHRGPDRGRAGGRAAIRPLAPVQREPAAHRGRDRGGGLGAGPAHPRSRAGAERDRAGAPSITRARSGRCGWPSSPTRPRSTTSGCGPRWPRLRPRPGTRPRLWAATSRSRKRCSTTWPSA